MMTPARLPQPEPPLYRDDPIWPQVLAGWAIVSIPGLVIGFALGYLAAALS